MKKKTKTVEFQIPEPCSENWNEMYPLPGGRFCDKCEKTLVDFTEMTDNELVRFFERNNKKVCGRFRPDQLNKEIEIPKVPSSFQKWKAVAAVATGLFAWNSGSAQVTTQLPVMGKVGPSFQEKVEFIELKEKNKPQPLPSIVKGIVKDESGVPLIGASIFLHKQKHIGTSTNVDGSFELKVPGHLESFALDFTYTGYETQTIKFHKKDLLEKISEVKLKESGTGLTGIVVIRSPMPESRFITGLTVTVPEPTITESESNKEVSSENEAEEELEKIEDPLPIENIFPNPFIDFVNLELNLENEDRYLFHLYNLKGELIWAKTYELSEGEQNLRLDFSLLNTAPGIHFLRITDGKHELQTKKIIKVSTDGEEGEGLISPIRS